MADYKDMQMVLKAIASVDDYTNTLVAYKLGEAMKAVRALPSAEITEEDVREWCYKRGLTIIDSALYLEMKSRWSSSAEYRKEI